MSGLSHLGESGRAHIRAAELAYAMAAKRTAGLFPFCHPPLAEIEVGIKLNDSRPGFLIISDSPDQRRYRTMVIGGIEIMSKTGGKSGDWKRR